MRANIQHIMTFGSAVRWGRNSKQLMRLILCACLFLGDRRIFFSIANECNGTILIEFLWSSYEQIICPMMEHGKVYTIVLWEEPIKWNGVIKSAIHGDRKNYCNDRMNERPTEYHVIKFMIAMKCECFCKLQKGVLCIYIYTLASSGKNAGQTV